ncbi:hypothetical protein HPB52_024021 [Rhipicephalus sanguineus]|uniref:Endonuclease/exonuclease/phosphatase domain-containing protein n=1 Tax=Rhipicephalus sanguineus TaxID=34632 RepID=A0A9D4SWZ8_RHISA|nr:hypothetical protein HPB52_024021 [Rhipicephalus sanguineus]
MENATDSPEKVTDSAVNMTAAAAMDTTPPAPTNDDETSPSNEDGSAWVLVQKERRTQADLLQGTKTSELQGKTTQRKPTASRPPPLPLHDYKAILRPLGRHPTLTRAIRVAASLPPAEVDRLVFSLRPEQNLAVVSTPHEHIALNLYSVQHLRLGEHTYPVSIYNAAPHNSCKGIIYGVDPGTSPSELMDHLITPGHTVLQARMMGKTSTALITFEGLQVPHYIRYYGAEYRCYVHRPCKKVCNCPTPNCVTCKTCGVDEPTPGHSCTPKCRSCGGDHPTKDTGCPARVRPPLNKERVRKVLQQEQQQRDLEYHSTPSSSPQGESQAAGPNTGKTSRSRSRSRRRSRSKARSGTHSRTGSQTPPVKRATTSEANGPLVTNQPSLPLKDSNQPDKNQGAEQRPAEPREGRGWGRVTRTILWSGSGTAGGLRGKRGPLQQYIAMTPMAPDVILLQQPNCTPPLAGFEAYGSDSEFSKLGDKLLICGDFNAAHSVWGYPKNTGKGTKLWDNICKCASPYFLTPNNPPASGTASREMRVPISR